MVFNNLFNKFMGVSKAASKSLQMQEQNESKTISEVNDKQANGQYSDEKKECEKEEQHSIKDFTSAIYNLIILDESGSMSNVTSQTISGCNETLNGIRSTAAEEKELRQYVSIFCFDTSNSRYLFKNKPIEEVKDLTSKDYHPNACTPLYDAIGYTVNELKKIATDSDSIAKVTIITDGYENASKEWNHSAIVELIESLKKKGWVFTFMGANIDVARTSRSLGIDSFMEFKQTDEGMKEMFCAERRSQRAYSKKMAFIRKSSSFSCADEIEKEQMLRAMNHNYFTDEVRIAPNYIHTLKPNEVFVFGSNIEGNHVGGAAAYAVANFRAIMGQAEGIQGQTYAIPTVGNSLKDIEQAILRFTEYAVMHPNLKFMLTEIGCGIAGYTPEQIAPLFRHAYEFGNVYVPKSFFPYVE